MNEDAANEANGWILTMVWTVGVPLFLAALVLGGAALNRRYSRLIARIPESIRFFQQPFFATHHLRNGFMSAALYFGTLMPGRWGLIFHTLFAALILWVGFFMALWGTWLLAVNRVADRPSRLYSSALLVMALLISLFAGLVFVLRDTSLK